MGGLEKKKVSGGDPGGGGEGEPREVGNRGAAGPGDPAFPRPWPLLGTERMGEEGSTRPVKSGGRTLE